ncbi:MAG: aspartate aminotransferase family protein [bacterium]
MTLPAMVNAYQPGTGNLTPEAAARIARRSRLLGPAYRLFYETPVHFTRGEGVWLYDAEGQAYLDCYNNVASVGHCHPHVVAATARQSALYASHTRYLNDTVLDYAERLLATFPAALSHVMFTCTGSEANDLALRIAFAHTGGTGVIVTENAYHGVTLATSALSPSLGAGVSLGADVRTVPAPSDPARFAADVAAAAADLSRHGIQPAALLVDTIFSSDGVYSDPPGFLEPAAEAIRAAGGLFIADEVQPGFGRTGDAMWGFQRHGVVPDMVSMGKPMGNGYPVAGLVIQPGVIAAFGAKARYFNTFGGNAVAAATAMAVLEVIEKEALQHNAATTGAYFRDGLLDLAQTRPALGPLRAAGLFLGQDIVTDGKPDPARAARLVNDLRARRILISATGPQGHVLKLRPPLVFSKANVDQVLDGLRAALT